MKEAENATSAPAGDGASILGRVLPGNFTLASSMVHPNAPEALASRPFGLHYQPILQIA